MINGGWTPGDISGLQTLVETPISDHLYASHINELRASMPFYNATNYHATNRTDVEIQAAIDDANANGGGIVFIPAGTWTISNTIQGYNHVFLLGEGKLTPYLRSITPQYGTILKADSALDGILDFDQKEDWGIEKMTIDGDDLATVGIYGGGPIGRHVDGVNLREIFVHNVNGDGINFWKGGSGYYRVKDSCLWDVHIDSCVRGFVGYAQGVRMYGGVIANCSECALFSDTGVTMWAYSTLFSGNGIDIELGGDLNIGFHMFNTCWFEEADYIVKRPDVPPTTKGMEYMFFDNCSFQNKVAVTDYMMDFTNVSTRIYIRGGNMRWSISGARTINIPEADCIVDIDNCVSQSGILFAGAGTGIVGGLIKRMITHDGGATQPIGKLPSNSVITGIWTYCAEPFNGAPTIDIGDSGNNSGLLANANIIKNSYSLSGMAHDERGAYLYDAVNKHDIDKGYTTPTTINAYVASPSTEGNLVVFIKFRGLEQ
jgi:hypothetical protein